MGMDMWRSAPTVRARAGDADKRNAWLGLIATSWINSDKRNRVQIRPNTNVPTIRTRFAFSKGDVTWGQMLECYQA